MTDLDYGPAREEEHPALGLLLNRSFATSGDEQTSQDWVAQHDPDRPRVLRDEGGLAACLLRLPMGQFFGGRSVPTLGIAGVGVPAERRGQGLAKRLMTECLREARRDGFALSTLYASTFRLYRHVGYERAGQRFVVKVDPQQLSAPRTSAVMRPLTEEDEPVVRELYVTYARAGTGLLDRGPDLWLRVRNPGMKPACGAAVVEDGQVTGYVRWVQVDGEGRNFDLVASDHAAATPTAARRLLAFLASHGTLAHQVVWFGGPGEPLLALLDTTRFELKHWDDWMLRLVDVPQALEARGYAGAVSGEVHLELEDDLFEENGGRFVLRVADGRGTVERGGDGGLVTSVRALAPHYTGHLTATQLRTTGWLQGDDASCALADALFAGPAPWMPDFF